MSNDLVVVTLSFNSWMVCWLGSAGMLNHVVISNLALK